jgi:hypothetical protein
MHAVVRKRGRALLFVDIWGDTSVRTIVIATTESQQNLLYEAREPRLLYLHNPLLTHEVGLRLCKITVLVWHRSMSGLPAKKCTWATRQPCPQSSKLWRSRDYTGHPACGCFFA